MFPHEPQFKLLVLVFTHDPLHIMNGALHPHEPPLHGVPAEHWIPQPPQFDGSLCVPMHDPPHSELPVGHAHPPFWHVVPPAQRFPHEPQFELSVASVAQRAVPLTVQGTCGAVHDNVHRPALHVCPLGQTTPQLPQLRTSLCTSVHVPLHVMLVAAQTHTPF